MLPSSVNLDLLRPQFKLPIGGGSPKNNNISCTDGGFYDGVFRLSPKFIGEDFVTFEISSHQIKKMPMDLSQDLNSPLDEKAIVTIAEPDHDLDMDSGLPLDLSPNPQPERPNSVDFLKPTDSFLKVKSPDLIAAHVTEKTGKGYEAIKTDEEKDADCFSFNFSIKKSFFAPDGSDEPKQQEVLLMDKMMKHCFGYILLSKSANSGCNSPPHVTFHPRLSPAKVLGSDLNRLSPAESVGSSFADMDHDLENKSLDASLNLEMVAGESCSKGSASSSPAFGQPTRNKRKRVQPQQRDTVIMKNKSISPNGIAGTVLQLDGVNGYLEQFESTFQKEECLKPTGSAIDNLAMDLSSHHNNNESPTETIKNEAFEVEPRMASSSVSMDSTLPLDLTQKESKLEPKVSSPRHAAPRQSPLFMAPPASNMSQQQQQQQQQQSVFTSQSQSNALAALQQQQQHVMTMAAIAGMFGNQGTPTQTLNSTKAYMNAMNPHMQSGGTDATFGALLKAAGNPMSHLFGTANNSGFDHYSAPDAKKIAYESKFKEEMNLLSQMGMTNQHPSAVVRSRLPSSKPSKSASPNSSTKEMLPCGVCGKRFKTYAYIKDHMRLHTGEKPFLCQFCPASFPNKSHLNYHIKSKHHPGVNVGSIDPATGLPMSTNFDFPGESPVLKCDLCFRQFNSKSALTLHMKRCGQRSDSGLVNHNSGGVRGSNSPATSPNQLQFLSENCASVMPQAAPGGMMSDDSSLFTAPSDLSGVSPNGVSSYSQSSPSSVSNLHSINQSIEATILSVTGGNRPHTGMY